MNDPIKEALYSPDGEWLLFVTEVSLEPTFAVGQQTSLFSLQPEYISTNGREGWVSLDDQRFVTLRSVSLEETELILVDNFFEELKRLVPN
jgi:hypothetical protein